MFSKYVHKRARLSSHIRHIGISRAELGGNEKDEHHETRLHGGGSSALKTFEAWQIESFQCTRLIQSTEQQDAKSEFIKATF